MRITICMIAALMCTTAVSAQRFNEGEDKLPDALMRQLVPYVVRQYFPPKAEPTTVLFLDEGLDIRWFPKIKNVTFRLVDLDWMKRNKVREVYVLFHGSYNDNEGYRVISFGYGVPRCGAGGDQWRFRVHRGRVRIAKERRPRWGSGCGSGDGFGNGRSARSISAKAISDPRFGC